MEHIINRQTINDNKFGFLLVLPSLLLLGIIVIFPIVYVIVLSMTTEANGINIWVGLKNYKTILFEDSKFWGYLLNSIKYMAYGVGSAFIVGLFVAISLNTIRHLKGLARTVSLLAWAVPPVIASLMWKWVLNDTNGALNFLFMSIGIIKNPIAWLAMENLTMFVLSQVHAWTAIPFIMVILLAGLQTIPMELYEVADIDGAGSIQKFRAITIPLLMPAIQSSVMLSTIFAFRTFDIVFTLTGGGPGETTEMLVTYVYNTAFVFGRIGYAAALSVIMVLISMAITMLFVKILPVKDL